MNENEARMTVVAVAKSLIEAGHQVEAGRSMLAEWLDAIAGQVDKRSSGGGGGVVATAPAPAVAGVQQSFEGLEPGEFEVMAAYANTTQRGDPWTKLILGPPNGPNIGVSFFGVEHEEASKAKRGDRVKCRVNASSKKDKAGNPLLNGSSLIRVVGGAAAPSPIPDDIPF